MAQQGLLRSLPIFVLAGSEPVQFTDLPPGSFLAPFGCRPELLQQVLPCTPHCGSYSGWAQQAGMCDVMSASAGACGTGIAL